MSWFTREIETVETAPQLSPLERYKQSCEQLGELGTELKTAEQELARVFPGRKDPRVRWIGTKMYVAVNGHLLLSPEAEACERRWTRAFRKFQQKMAETAELKRAAGLIR